MLNVNNLYQTKQDVATDTTDILSVSEVAEYLGVGKNQIYELLKNKTLKGFRMGSTWKISKLALNMYIREASGL